MNLIEYVRSRLTEFVGIPSTPESDMGNILRAATAAIEELGLRPTVHRDLNAVTASSGSGGVLLNGHLDTVPIASGWTREQGSWDGDFLYGRGTADMKKLDAWRSWRRPGRSWTRAFRFPFCSRRTRRRRWRGP